MTSFESRMTWADTTRQVKRAVPVSFAMRNIVRWLKRGRNRFDCGLCQADHRQCGTVSINDGKGVWHCFRCGAGGSAFDLIMLAHNCDFLTALKFLAEEARIELPAKMTAEERRRLAEREAKRKRIGGAAGKLDRAEHELRLWYRNLIHHSEQKQDQVRQRLGELYGGAPERWRDEYEGCWAWLTALVPLLREHLAAYTLLAFGSAQDRARFVLLPQLRQQMIDCALKAGGCFDKYGRWTEVLE